MEPERAFDQIAQLTGFLQLGQPGLERRDHAPPGEIAQVAAPSLAARVFGFFHRHCRKVGAGLQVGQNLRGLGSRIGGFGLDQDMAGAGFLGQLEALQVAFVHGEGQAIDNLGLRLVGSIHAGEQCVRQDAVAGDLDGALNGRVLCQAGRFGLRGEGAADHQVVGQLQNDFRFGQGVFAAFGRNSEGIALDIGGCDRHFAGFGQHGLRRDGGNRCQ